MSKSKPVKVAIRAAYVEKLKRIAAETGASVEAFVNQCISDVLEASA